MKRKRRVAIVGGAGSWGWHYTGGYARRTDCKIVGLVDTVRERGERFAAHHDIDTVGAW